MFRSSFLGLMFAALVSLGSFGCAATLPGDEIIAQLRADSDRCTHQSPRGSARCWFDLALARSTEGDATLYLDHMEQVMDTHRLAFEDFGVTPQVVETVRQRGHLQRARRAYGLLRRLAPTMEVSLLVNEIYAHLALADAPLQAIERGLDAQTIRALERQGDIAEAKKYLAMARRRPNTHTARVAITNLQRLLSHNGHEIAELSLLDPHLTWTELERLR